MQKYSEPNLSSDPSIYIALSNHHQMSSNPTDAGGQIDHDGISNVPSTSMNSTINNNNQELILTETIGTPTDSHLSISSVGPNAPQYDKIINHPLYPLLRVILRKCDLATGSIRSSSTLASSSSADSNTDGQIQNLNQLNNGVGVDGGASLINNFNSLTISTDVFSPESLNENIREFIRYLPELPNRNQSDGENNPTVDNTADPELDKFMLQAIQVLRGHLLELEKVHQLCEMFCSRYITKLKDELPINEILDGEENPQVLSGNDFDSDDDDDDYDDDDYDASANGWIIV